MHAQACAKATKRATETSPAGRKAGRGETRQPPSGATPNRQAGRRAKALRRGRLGRGLRVGGLSPRVTGGLEEWLPPLPGFARVRGHRTRLNGRLPLFFTLPSLCGARPGHYTSVRFACGRAMQPSVGFVTFARKKLRQRNQCRLSRWTNHGRRVA